MMMQQSMMQQQMAQAQDQQQQQQQPKEDTSEDSKSQKSQHSQVNVQSQPFIPKGIRPKEEQKELPQIETPEFIAPIQQTMSPDFQMQQNFMHQFGQMPDMSFNRPFISTSGLPQTQILEPSNYYFARSESPVNYLFDEELLYFVRHITLRVKEAEVERKTVLNIIKEAAKHEHFPSSEGFNNGPIINVFGSMQTGIAIDSSDMDVLVSGNFGSSRQELLDNMQILLNKLVKFESVSNYQFIDTASVPVIKIDYNLTTLDISERHHTYRTNNELSQIMRRLKVDICFEQVQNRQELGLHQGRQCIQFIKEMILMRPMTQYLAIIIKKILAHKEYNKPFSGGLGSYAVVLMILGFLSLKDPDGLMSIGELFIGFLDYFGNEFDPQSHQIHKNLMTGDIVIQEVTFIEPCHLSIIDPLNLQNNVGKTTYNFQEIQSFFSSSHAKIIEMQKQMQQKQLPHKSDFMRQVFDLSLQPNYSKRKYENKGRFSQKSDSYYGSGAKNKHHYDSDYLSQGSGEYQLKSKRKPSQK